MDPTDHQTIYVSPRSHRPPKFLLALLGISILIGFAAGFFVNSRLKNFSITSPNQMMDTNSPTSTSQQNISPIIITVIAKGTIINIQNNKLTISGSNTSLTFSTQSTTIFAENKITANPKNKTTSGTVGFASPLKPADLKVGDTIQAILMVVKGNAYVASSIIVIK